MDYGHYTTQTMEETVGLINGLASDRDPLDVEALSTLLERFHEDDSERVDVEGLAHLAGRLQQVFTVSQLTEKARILNELIAFYQPNPSVTDHDGQGYHMHYGPEGAGHLRRVGASMTMALASVLCDYGADRLGVCPACHEVFVDTTRNGRQRFCSKACANRVHVAEHRARNKSGQ